MKTISKIQSEGIMRRKLKVIALSLFVSMSVVGCGNSTSASVTTNSVTTTSSETISAPEEKEASDELLPFGFTPKEFYDNFADYASYLSIPGRFPSPVRFPEITIPSNRKSQYRTWKSAFRWLYNGDMHWFYQCKSIIRRSVFYDQIS